MDDPLDFIDPDEIFEHGNPDRWKFIREKPGSGVPAHSPNAPPGTLKIYEIYQDAYGEVIEVHYLSFTSL